jgi:hypothetical protein
VEQFRQQLSDALNGRHCWDLRRYFGKTRNRGSIIGGAVTHMFSRPTNQRFHPAGLIFSTVGAILVLFICYKLKIHFPAVNPF